MLTSIDLDELTYLIGRVGSDPDAGFQASATDYVARARKMRRSMS